MALKHVILPVLLFAAFHTAVAQPLEFERTQIDGIRLSEDDPKTDFVFAFTNTDSVPVVITRVETSCGCVAADYPTRPVAPGAKDRVLITYNPKGHPGTLARRVLVYTSDSRDPVALELAGEVTPTADKWSRYPVVLGELRAKLNKVSFGAISRTGLRNERIECVNSSERPLTLSASSESYGWLSLHTEPETISPGQTADIVVVIDGPSIPADVSGKVEYTLLVEGMEGRPSQRIVRVTAQID